MQVDVEQPDPAGLGRMARDHAELDRAVAAEREKHPVGVERLVDPIGRQLGYLGDGGDVLRRGAGRVGRPPPAVQVAQVVDADAGREQVLDQAGRAQCGRRVLLPRRERPDARRNAQ